MFLLIEFFGLTTNRESHRLIVVAGLYIMAQDLGKPGFRILFRLSLIKMNPRGKVAGTCYDRTTRPKDNREIAMNLRVLTSVFALACLAQTVPAQNTHPETGVLPVARAFKDGGHYDITNQGTGVPEELTFKGEKILSADPHGSYCCGFTLSVVLQTAANRGLLKDKTPKEVRHFQKEWYGATTDTRELTCTKAMTDFKIGRAVKFEDAQAGDFVQFWRGKTGHSVVFLNWVEKNGKKIGIHYRSSQTGTDGIGDRTEYFADSGVKGGQVLRERTYFARLNDQP